MNISIKRGVCILPGWGSSNLTNQKQREGAVYESIEKQPSQPQLWCLFSTLPKGLLCQDLCGAESLTAESLDAGEEPVFAWACFCFIAWWIWALPFPLQRPTIRTKCFTLLSVKNLLFFQIFYKFIHPWKPDIPYFILLRGCHCEGCGFTCNRPPLALISLTATNCKWRTNERNIYKFHGNSGGA